MNLFHLKIEFLKMCLDFEWKQSLHVFMWYSVTFKYVYAMHSDGIRYLSYIMLKHV